MTAAQTREQHPPGMEITGFVVLSTSSDGTSQNSEVARCLESNAKIEQGTLVYGKGDTKICQSFLQAGTEENNAFSAKIKEAIGEVSFMLRQGPVIVRSEKNDFESGPRLAHPSRGAVSIFRDLSVSEECRVTFKLYAPDLRKEYVGKTQPVSRKLRPADILFVKGSTWMEIFIPSQGSFVWQGNSANPMGHDIMGPDVFEFMTV